MRLYTTTSIYTQMHVTNKLVLSRVLVLFKKKTCNLVPTDVNLAAEVSDKHLFGETHTDVDVKTPKPKAVVQPIKNFSRDQPIKVEDFIAYMQQKKYDFPDHELVFDFQVV